MKALLIIAHQNFQDQEYQEVRRALEEKGVLVSVASSSKNIATGKFGTEINPEFNLDEIKVDSYDVLCFIGGPGAEEYFENEKAWDICKKIISKGKILSAICIAPVILAKAKVLEGKEATVWSSDNDRSTIEKLKLGGAIYTDKPIEVDDNVVTACGPEVAYDFGNKIVEVLQNKIKAK